MNQVVAESISHQQDVNLVPPVILEGYLVNNIWIQVNITESSKWIVDYFYNIQLIFFVKAAINQKERLHQE